MERRSTDTRLRYSRDTEINNISSKQYSPANHQTRLPPQTQLTTNKYGENLRRYAKNNPPEINELYTENTKMDTANNPGDVLNAETL